MKKKLRRALTVVLALVLVVSVGYLSLKQVEYRRGAQDYAEAQEIAGVPDLTKVPAAAPRDSAQPGEEETEAEAGDPWLAALAETDLEALRAANPDVAGWICIPDTELSYPILQGENDQYYLSHTWLGQKSAAGAIFLSCRSSRSLTDPYSLIYGHRMNNSTMFGTLKFYSGQEFWQAHPSVYLVREGGVDRYDVFAAFEASVYSDIYRLDLPEEEREAFLTWCREQSVIDTGLAPGAEDRLVTLSTCTASGGAASRWVVVTVLTDTLPMS